MQSSILFTQVMSDHFGRRWPRKGITSIFLNGCGQRVWTGGFGWRILWRMTLSARNRLEGKVVEIEFGGVMAHVVISVGKNMIESVITKRSAEEMKLKVGDTVSAVIKSTEVMLEKN